VAIRSALTSLQEEEAEKLIVESRAKNFIDDEGYPKAAEIQSRCVSMIGRLFHAPFSEGPVGTSIVGIFEAVMLAMLAMKLRWQIDRKVQGKPLGRPNIIMSSSVQIYWMMAAQALEVEEKYAYCTESRFVADPAETISLIDENTIGICYTLGTPYTGEYEDVEGLNVLLEQKGLATPVHVDADSGGFVAPFIVPGLVWDFRKLQPYSGSVVPETLS
jgi:glutamate decarboxylase